MIDPRDIWQSRPVPKLGPVRHIRIPRPWWQRWRDAILELFTRRTR